MKSTILRATHLFDLRFLSITSIVVLLFTLTACSPKTAKKTTEIPPIEEPTEVVIKSDTLPTTEVVVPPPPEPVEVIPYVVLRMEKTACYGHCPIFEIKLFSDGRANFIGKANTDLMGHYEAHADEEFLSAISAKAQKTDYFRWADHYPLDGNYLSDLPNTITYLKIEEQEKSIIRNHDGPVALRQFEEDIFNAFQQLNWVKID